MSSVSARSSRHVRHLIVRLDFLGERGMHEYRICSFVIFRTKWLAEAKHGEDECAIIEMLAARFPSQRAEIWREI